MLPNGSLLLSARDYDNGHHPLWAISDNGGESWHSLKQIKTVLTATCDASLLAVNSTFYYSRPNSLERKNLTISMTKDYGREWAAIAPVWPQAAAYSCLSRVNISYIGVLYEAGDTGPYEAVHFSAVRILP